MPYIKDENNRRQELRDGAVAKTAGELNFQIFSYVHSNSKYISIVYWLDNTYSPLVVIDYVKAFLGSKPNYQKYNDMAGCLLLCYKELKRRLGIELEDLKDIIDWYDNPIAVYEDIKIEENGDVI